MKNKTKPVGQLFLLGVSAVLGVWLLMPEFAMAWSRDMRIVVGGITSTTHTVLEEQCITGGKDGVKVSGYGEASVIIEANVSNDYNSIIAKDCFNRPGKLKVQLSIPEDKGGGTMNVYARYKDNKIKDCEPNPGRLVEKSGELCTVTID